MEIGKVYEGPVTKILDFGALINLLPGKDGLLHISQIAHERVEKVTDYLSEGQIVKVKVLETDEKGRVKLSMKALAERPAGMEFQDRPPREDRGDRGDRRERSDRGDRGDRGDRRAARRHERTPRFENNERAPEPQAEQAVEHRPPAQDDGPRRALKVDAGRWQRCRRGDTMKAIEITTFGAPEVLRVVERPDPVAGAGELLIRVAASGVNRPDVLQRKGHYPVPPGASDLPGLEIAGEIVAGDAAALARAGFKIGDHVCALVAGGGYAELCVAPVANACRCPRAGATSKRRACPRPSSPSGPTSSSAAACRRARPC